MIMKTLDIIKLNETGSQKVVDALQVLLADLQIYYTNLRNFHWNVRGKGFFQLHDKYEEMYQNLFGLYELSGLQVLWENQQRLFSKCQDFPV